MKRTILITILSIIYCLNSIACTCIGKSSVKNEVYTADVVLAGEILSKRIFTVQDEDLPPEYAMKRTEVKILKTCAYKGDLIGDTVTVVTGTEAANCGIDFLVGSKYIIYAEYTDEYHESGTVKKQVLYTDSCSSTKPFNNKEAKQIKRYVRRDN